MPYGAKEIFAEVLCKSIANFSTYEFEKILKKNKLSRDEYEQIIEENNILIF